MIATPARSPLIAPFTRENSVFKPDPLACCDVDPAGYDNKEISADELWEEVLNHVMKNGLGWGTSLGYLLFWKQMGMV